ncbi:energy transducer TonB [Massilia cavernae]|uniref:Energy transducer TonB n=1 Tax=Massilia cavernae TaxID=2320864 RepID=A0A418Y5N4_9BURK|nr:energy transducer TonB [Massilia cavernae]
MAFSHAAGRAFALPQRAFGRIGPVAGVAAAHLLLFYAASSGLLSRVVEAAMPEPVLVTFVAAPEPPPPPKPPAMPKTVALAQRLVMPVVPLVRIAPLENAISLPQQAAPAIAEAVPVPAAVSAPPAPVQAAVPKTISSGVEYIEPPQPVYPPLSKRLGEQGKVVLKVLVNEKGLAEQVTVQGSSGFPRLDEAGRQAAKRALFKPHLEDGRAVAVFVIVPLNFQLG